MLERGDMARLFEGIAQGNVSRLRVYLWDESVSGVRDDAGRSLLHAACESRVDRHALMAFLIERGADVNAVDGRGETPLHLCARQADEFGVNMLLANHANALVLNRAQRTALHEAAARGASGATLALLEHQGRPSVALSMQDASGDTPLHLAARHLPLVVPALLAHGADPRILNAAGERASDTAASAAAARALQAYCRLLDARDSRQAPAPDAAPGGGTELARRGLAMLAIHEDSAGSRRPADVQRPREP